jgi:hypothetical protein
MRRRKSLIAKSWYRNTKVESDIASFSQSCSDRKGMFKSSPAGTSEISLTATMSAIPRHPVSSAEVVLSLTNVSHRIRSATYNRRNVRRGNGS